jgi:hypothetical protein
MIKQIAMVATLGLILTMVATIPSQIYVKKASALFTPMHGIGSCPAGKVRDWAGICFDKSVAKACITCAPGSAAPAEKPEALPRVETNKEVEKPTVAEAEKPSTTPSPPKGINPEKWAKLSPSQQKGIAEMERALNSKSVRDQVMKENCARMSLESEYGDCIRYGLEMREWQEKYGENPKSPEAQKHQVWFRPTGAPPPAGFERPLLKSLSLSNAAKEKLKEANEYNARVEQARTTPTNNTIRWFDKELEKHSADEGEKPNSTAAESLRH